MPALLLLSAIAGAAMAAAIVWLVRPADRLEVILRGVVATVLAASVATTAGVLTDAEDPMFLLAVSFGAAPVAILLGAAAGEAAPGRRSVARVLVWTWSGVVFPICVVVPPLLYRTCGAPECRVEDFGASLALLVSSSASVLLAWRANSVAEGPGWVRFAAPVALLWVSAAAWLVSLEGAVDAYTARILLAAVLSPLAGGLAWLLVDVLRQTGRHPVRSFADGVAAGLVAIVPGAASVSFPWSLVVGASAGAAAALVFGAKRIASAGRAGHWALVALSATAIGYLAPAISGDTIGFMFSGRIAAFLPPLATFLAVAAFGIVTSAPAWSLARRTARGEGPGIRKNEKTPG